MKGEMLKRRFPFHVFQLLIHNILLFFTKQTVIIVNKSLQLFGCSSLFLPSFDLVKYLSL